MSRSSLAPLLLLALTAAVSVGANAQTVNSSNSLIVLPVAGEMTYVNDQARATFAVEEQDRDKTVAASRVNQKMKAGADIIKRQDPQAMLKNTGYYTYAVYADEVPVVNGRAAKARSIVGWRVGQALEATTTNLDGLPKLAAAAQNAQLTLNGIQFGLAPATSKKLDSALLDATVQRLNERVAALATAMHRNASDASLEALDFEGSGNFSNDAAPMAKGMMMRAAMAQPDVAEPSFERGETTLSLRAVAKLRFK